MKNTWVSEGWSKLKEHPHVRGCVTCKEILDQVEISDDADYRSRAKEMINDHIRKGGKTGPACEFTGCIHHDHISGKLAMTILRIAGEKTEKDYHGVRVGSVELVVKKDDHPAGHDMTKADATRRYFTFLKDSAGSVYFRFLKKDKVEVHIWADYTYSSRRANADDPVALWEILDRAKFQPEHTRWCVQKYQEMKTLAEMDMSL